MKKQLIKDLKQLAKKYGMELSESCIFCGHHQENLDLSPKCGDSFMVTFTEIKPV